MPAGKWKVYESAKQYIGDGTIDLDANTFAMALFTSASNANTLAGLSTLSALTNQVANANGYTTGGVALGSITWTNAAGTMTFTSANAQWAASGGSITARYAVVYRTGTVNSVTNAILCVCLLDTAPADVTVTAGNTLTIQINASGIFNMSGATTD